jgi:hypothetical protein
MLDKNGNVNKNVGDCDGSSYGGNTVAAVTRLPQHHHSGWGGNGRDDEATMVYGELTGTGAANAGDGQATASLQRWQ